MAVAGNRPRSNPETTNSRAVPGRGSGKMKKTIAGNSRPEDRLAGRPKCFGDLSGIGRGARRECSDCGLRAECAAGWPWVPMWCTFPDHRRVVAGISECDTDCPKKCTDGRCEDWPVRLSGPVRRRPSE